MTSDVTIDLETGKRERAHLLRAAEKKISRLLGAEQASWISVNPRAGVPVEAIGGLVESGGKRLRPLFCITGYLAAGGQVDNDDVVAASAALELLHAFALIHDDVMDESAQRRGRPTVHARHCEEHARDGRVGEPGRFGDNVAILAGDLALVYADAMMADHPGARAIWTELRSELIIGQWMDVEASTMLTVDPELARWIAVVKSGRYTIHRPLQLGAVLADRQDLVAPFESYGTAVGEAFQLRDDLIDLFGDAALTGKPSRLDLDQHKMTLVLSLAFTRDAGLRAAYLRDRGDLDTFVEMLVKTGVPDEVERRIDELVEVGEQALLAADLTPAWRDELSALARQVAYRET